MRTEDDIRRALDLEPDHDALTRLTHLVSDLGADGLGSGVHTDDRVRTPRRRVLPLLAAAAIVAVAGGAVALVHAQDSTRTPPGGGDPHRSTAAQRRPVYDLRIRPVPGYVVTRVRAVGVGTTTGGATASVDATSANRPERGEVYTCESRRLSACNVPTPRAHGQRVTIHGRTGYFVPGRPVIHSSRRLDDDPWSAAQDDDHGPGLSYVGDRHTVVIITGTFGFDPGTYDYDNALAKRIMLRIASATSVGHHDAVLMPFALRDLPGRVFPEVTQIKDGEHCIAYGTGHPANEFGSVLTACRVRTGPSRSATIRAASDIDPGEGDTIVVHDFPGHTSVVIEVDRGQERLVPRAQAHRLAEQADVSPDLRDPSTWIAVR